MEYWQKLIQVLVEIWVEEDIKSGKIALYSPKEISSNEVTDDDRRKAKAA